MLDKKYNREEAVQYAHKWAYSRNPDYYDFEKIGGDCTNFVSQCIFAGSKKMNYNKNGWYYKSGYDKSPSWTGVEFIYNFITKNKGVGPFGIESKMEDLEIGDLIQLSFDGEKFAHSLIIVDIINKENLSGILIASHTFDSDYRKVSTYNFEEIRFIHIMGIKSF